MATRSKTHAEKEFIADLSVGSAWSLGSGRLPTLVLVVVELAIGLSVVGLKIVVGH